MFQTIGANGQKSKSKISCFILAHSTILFITITDFRNNADSQESRSEIDFKELFEHFVKVQRMHHTQKMAQRKRSVLLWDNDSSVTTKE